MLKEDRSGEILRTNSAGGNPFMPIGQTFFRVLAGMFVDWIHWMVNFDEKKINSVYTVFSLNSCGLDDEELYKSLLYNPFCAVRRKPINSKWVVCSFILLL
jgi:hypothetical protein